MNGQKFRCTIEIAGIPAEICCFRKENRDFFKDYLSDRAPLFTVEPSTDDLERMRQTMDRLADYEGRPRAQHSPVLLESNAIHELLAEKLAGYNILMLHGSALSMDGEAYIFTAPSGTGKSTHARLWRETFGNRVIMINDDKPLLKITDSCVFVYGTPWDGKHHLSCNCCAPLKAIVRLSRSTVNHIEPMDKAGGFLTLMEQVYLSKDPVNKTRILTMINRIVHLSDFYHLGCTMAPETAMYVWNYIHEENRNVREE